MNGRRVLIVSLILLAIATAVAADDIDAKSKAIGAASLGKPSGPARQLAGGGWVRAYGKGAIYSSAETGTHAVYGAAFRRYKALGAHASKLGLPVTDVNKTGDGGSQVVFQHGAILISRTGAVRVRTLPDVTFTETSATIDGGTASMASATEAIIRPPLSPAGEDTKITCSCQPVLGRPGTTCSVVFEGNTVTCNRGSCSACTITITR